MTIRVFSFFVPDPSGPTSSPEANRASIDGGTAIRRRSVPIDRADDDDDGGCTAKAGSGRDMDGFDRSPTRGEGTPEATGPKAARARARSAAVLPIPVPVVDTAAVALLSSGRSAEGVIVEGGGDDGPGVSRRGAGLGGT
mmetsp:Transcript_25236/g.51493  ORF Transcript_25236/g.51493 Transcript_25236/m.51493 type:complete len:140 (+) Transcript_25236:1017-1436(+)